MATLTVQASRAENNGEIDLCKNLSKAARKPENKTSNDDDERSTEAGSSDAETSGNEETPKACRPQIDTADKQCFGTVQQFWTLLGCPRRKVTGQSSVPQESVLILPRTDFALTPKVTMPALEVMPPEVTVACISQKTTDPECNRQQQRSSQVIRDHPKSNDLERDMLPYTGISQLVFPPGFRPPPGLPPPPALEQLMRQHGFLPAGDAAAQVLDASSDPVSVPVQIPHAFNVVCFHKALVVILRELASDRNTGRAVQSVRAHQVPVSHHAAEFADILTRALETKNGMARRSMIAFAVGLAAGDPSAFDHDQCAEGLKIFFHDIYKELCHEVPKLPTLVAAELFPTLRLVFPAARIQKCIPRPVPLELKQKLRKEQCGL